MTLPRNFPGRKNQRRIEALARLGKLNGGTPPGRTNGLSLAADIAHLRSLIIDQTVARAIRTKKHRRNFARLAAE